LSPELQQGLLAFVLGFVLFCIYRDAQLLAAL
jgi:hypothetical protein